MDTLDILDVVCRMPRCVQCQTVPVSTAKVAIYPQPSSLLDGSGIHTYIHRTRCMHVVGKSKSKHERISGVIGVQVVHHLAFFVHVSSKYECERGPGAVSVHSRGILHL